MSQVKIITYGRTYLSNGPSYGVIGEITINEKNLTKYLANSRKRGERITKDEVVSDDLRLVHLDRGEL